MVSRCYEGKVFYACLFCRPPQVSSVSEWEVMIHPIECYTSCSHILEQCLFFFFLQTYFKNLFPHLLSLIFFVPFSMTCSSHLSSIPNKWKWTVDSGMLKLWEQSSPSKWVSNSTTANKCANKSRTSCHTQKCIVPANIPNKKELKWTWQS